MKKLLLAAIAALLLATGTAQAVEWQCGPHYVDTMVLHTERLGPPYSIIAYPFYNRTREDVIKNKLPSGGDEELGLPSKGFRWGYAPHPKFRGQRLLTYRGKPCFQRNENLAPIWYRCAVPGNGSSARYEFQIIQVWGC